MIFKNKHDNKPDLHFRIEIDDKHIEKVEVTKFLGVLIDNNLSWKAHTNHITKIFTKRETLLQGDTAAVSGSWKLPLPAPAKNQCLTCCLTCCFWCWISHWVLLILSWSMWLRGRSGGLWLGRDPGGVGGSVKIGDWVFDLVGIFPWLRSFGLTFRLLVLREYSYLGVYLSAVTIWSMPFVLVSCC